MKNDVKMGKKTLIELNIMWINIFNEIDFLFLIKLFNSIYFLIHWIFVQIIIFRENEELRGMQWTASENKNSKGWQIALCRMFCWLVWTGFSNSF